MGILNKFRMKICILNEMSNNYFEKSRRRLNFPGTLINELPMILEILSFSSEIDCNSFDEGVNWHRNSFDFRSTKQHQELVRRSPRAHRHSKICTDRFSITPRPVLPEPEFSILSVCSITVQLKSGDANSTQERFLCLLSYGTFLPSLRS